MLTRVLPPHGAGGMAALAWDLARAMREAGARVEVVTTTGGRPADDAGVPVHVVEAPAGRYSRAWWRGSLAAARRPPGEAPHVVLGVSAAAHALAARRAPGGPAFVFQAHGTSAGEIASRLGSGRASAWPGAARNLAWGLGRDWAYRRYDAVVAVGAAVERQLKAWPTRALVGAAPVTLIRNGVRAGPFAFRPAARARLRAALCLSPQTTLALFAARLQPDKGAAAAVAAARLALSRERDVALVVLGDGPEADRLARLAGRGGEDGRILVHGGVAREAVADWLSAADVLLFPTRRVEGLPLIVLEALAAGLPVLTTPLGAADPEIDALRLAPGDVEGFAAALGRVRAAPWARGDRLPRPFHLEDSVRAYLDLFERLVAGPSGGAA